VRTRSLHGLQRPLVGCIGDQGRAEVVADVLAVRPLEAVLLAGVGVGVGVEVEHAPVVDVQNHVRVRTGDGRADSVLKGLDEGGERDVLVVEEAAPGLALTDAMDLAMLGKAEKPVTAAFTLCVCSFTN
jgi:hypothetical protein